jgi:flagellar protein FliO/FliZ
VRRKLACAAVAVLALALALAPGSLAPASLRGLAATAALGLAALLARGRLAGPETVRRLAVVSRQPLSRDAGVALVEVDGRALLVGFGASGVRLLAGPPGAAALNEPEPGGAPSFLRSPPFEARS